MEKRTKRKSAKVAVETDNISSSIVQLVHDAIMVVDEDQNIILFNQGAEQTFGYKASEVIGQRLDLLLPPQASDFHSVYVRTFAKDPEPARLMGERKEVSGRRKNGAIFPAEASIAKVSSGGKIFFTAILRDITERKRAEQVLRETKEKQSMVLNGVDEIIYQVNYPKGSSVVKGRVEFVNERTQGILGFQPTDFITDPNLWFNMIHPEDLPSVKAQTTKIFKTGQPGLRHYRIKDTNGEYRWMEDQVSPEKNKAGRVVRMFGVARDITERKQAEQQMKELSMAVEQTADCVVITDREGVILYVNAAFEKETGYTPAEALGKTPRILKSGEHDARFFEVLWKTILAGKVFKAEFINRKKTGELVYEQKTITPLKDTQGNITHFVSTAKNITEQVQAEKALRESEKQYRDLFESTSDLIQAVAPDGRLLFVNRAWREAFGYTEQELINLNIDRVVHPEALTQVFETLQRAMSGEQVDRIETRFVTKEGKSIIVEGSVACRFEASQPIAITCFLRDITERKQAEEETRKLHNAVEQSADIIFITDKNGVIEYVNPAFETITGYSKEESIGKSPNILSSGLMETEYYQKMWTTILSGEVFRGEVIDRKKGGEIFYYDQTITPLKDEHGNITHFVSTGKDVTERKRAEERIETQLKRLDALHTIDTAITNSDELQMTLNVVLEQAANQLGMDAASILLLNPETQMLAYAAARGFHTDAVKTASIPLGESFAGLATLECRFVQVLDLATAQENADFADLWINEGITAYYVTPLIVKGQVKGVLEVFQRTPITQTSQADEWLNFFDTLAGQAAIAVDNANLFEGLQHANTELTRAYDATIEGWSQAMDLRDKETEEGHTLRVTALAERLARAMGMSNDELIHVRRGALLHDIGKMGVPDGVLLKPDKLTDEEWVLMKKHPQFAYDMLASIAYLKPALDIPYCHHEKWDGTGYPRGLKGEQIPLAARIFSVVDVWDALRSDRPYRKGWEDEKVLEHIQAGSGTHFDPEVVVMFQDMMNKDE